MISFCDNHRLAPPRPPEPRAAPQPERMLSFDLDQLPKPAEALYKAAAWRNSTQQAKWNPKP